MIDSYKLWISKITYKPNVFLSIFENHPYDMFFPSHYGYKEPDIFLRIEAQVPDVNNPSIVVPVTAQMRTPPNLLQYQFINWVGNQLMDLEKHEFKEWYKFEGQNVEDPHPEIRLMKERMKFIYD